MPIEVTNLKLVKIDFRCEVCSRGYYRPRTQVYSPQAPQYMHECDKCSSQRSFWCMFPTTAYVPEGETLDTVAWSRAVAENPLQPPQFPASFVPL